MPSPLNYESILRSELERELAIPFRSDSPASGTIKRRGETKRLEQHTFDQAKDLSVWTFEKVDTFSTQHKLLFNILILSRNSFHRWFRTKWRRSPLY